MYVETGEKEEIRTWLIPRVVIPLCGVDSFGLHFFRPVPARCLGSLREDVWLREI